MLKHQFSYIFLTIQTIYGAILFKIYLVYITNLIIFCNYFFFTTSQYITQKVQKGRFQIRMKFCAKDQVFQWKLKTEFPYAKHHKPAPKTIGRNQITHRISTFTEFDPLKEVIIGYIDQTASRNKDLLLFGEKQFFQDGRYPQHIVQEAAKNLEDQSQIYQKNGVKVIRVGQMDFTEEFQIQNFKSFGFVCFSPRDIPFIYHDSFYEFPTFNLSRVTQFKAFEWIEDQLHKKGSKIYSSWVSIPCKPNFRYQIQELEKSYLSENQYFADAANLVKLGLDILFLISMSGSVGCYNKFKSLMDQKYEGKVRVHPVKDVYEGVHIDSSIAVAGWNKKLGKYLVFVQGYRTNPTNIPAIFRGKNWAVLDFTEFDEQHHIQPLSSPSIAMNFVPIDSQNICISSNQKRLKEILEFYGIKAIPIVNKYSKTLGGGNHCTTNDIYREDVHGFGKILQKPTSELRLQQRAGLFDPQLLTFLESKGSIQDWTEICNQNGIFPTYTYDHLNEQQKAQVQSRHKKAIDSYKK